jgi:hypothetical protein
VFLGQVHDGRVGGGGTGAHGVKEPLVDDGLLGADLGPVFGGVLAGAILPLPPFVRTSPLPLGLVGGSAG